MYQYIHIYTHTNLYNKKNQQKAFIYSSSDEEQFDKNSVLIRGHTRVRMNKGNNYAVPRSKVKASTTTLFNATGRFRSEVEISRDQAHLLLRSVLPENKTELITNMKVKKKPAWS